MSLIRVSSIIASTLLLVTAPAFAGSFTLRKAEQKIIKVSKKSVMCGLHGKSWQVVKKSGKKFVLVSRPPAAQKTACGKLLGRGKIKSLAQLPADASIIRTKRRSSATLAAVSGTPPAVIDINDIGSNNVFWRSGTIEGLLSTPADTSKCGEFFISSTDGESAGYEGCNTVEDLGYTFEPLLRSGTNLCYARNLPTQTNVDSGVVTVVSGTLPDDKIANVFTTPSGSTARTVKLSFTSGGQASRTAFIEIAASDTNVSKGAHFSYRYWLCGSNSEGVQVKVYETAQVKLDGTVVVTRVGDDNYGTFNASTSGRLRVESGSLEYDPTVTRTADIRYLSISEMNRFKASLSASSGGLFQERFLNLYRGRLSKKYFEANVDGTTLQDLRVKDLAFKDILTEEDSSVRNFSGGIEYRDSGYRSAPTNTLVSSVAEADLTTTFYDDIGTVTFDSSDYSCTATPDIELAVNLDATGAQTLVSECSDETDQVNNFCREADGLMSILNNYSTTCGS